MKKRNFFIIGTILLLFFSIVFFNFYTGRQKCEGGNRLITLKRLSDEKSFPFHKLGHPLSYWKDKTPYYDEYRAAIARFPEVRACLVDSEREKQTPNLNLFDWNKIKGLEDAEVCAFRVFSSIGSVEGSKQWLEGQGFKISSIDREGPDMGIQARWPRECGNRYEEPWSWSRAIHDMLIDADFWLGVWITADNEVKSASGGFNSK